MYKKAQYLGPTRSNWRKPNEFIILICDFLLNCNETEAFLKKLIVGNKPITKTIKNYHNQGAVKFLRLYVANTEEKKTQQGYAECMVGRREREREGLETINSLSVLLDSYYKISIIKGLMILNEEIEKKLLDLINRKGVVFIMIMPSQNNLWQQIKKLIELDGQCIHLVNLTLHLQIFTCSVGLYCLSQ